MVPVEPPAIACCIDDAYLASSAAFFFATTHTTTPMISAGMNAAGMISNQRNWELLSLSLITALPLSDSSTDDWKNASPGAKVRSTNVVVVVDDDIVVEDVVAVASVSSGSELERVGGDGDRVVAGVWGVGAVAGVVVVGRVLGVGV